MPTTSTAIAEEEEGEVLLALRVRRALGAIEVRKEEQVEGWMAGRDLRDLRGLRGLRGQSIRKLCWIWPAQSGISWEGAARPRNPRPRHPIRR